MQSEFAAAAGSTPANPKVVAEINAISLIALRFVFLSYVFIEPSDYIRIWVGLNNVRET
jgi:hypothetical protein